MNNKYYEFNDCITEVSAPIVLDTEQIIIDIKDGGMFFSDTYKYKKQFTLYMSGRTHYFDTERERNSIYSDLREILFEEPEE
jgi:hypothetical protein